MALTIKTNKNWRPFVYRYDVPAKVLADQFSHLSENDASDGFFCYRDYWYHVSDFMRADSFELVSLGWTGYAGDSYFSGVVISVHPRGERYKVGTYFS